MEKKFTFSDQPLTSKIIYGVVIAILCISAIVVGIVAANNRKQTTNETTPPPEVEQPTPTPDDKKPAEPEKPDKPEAKTPVFVAPVVGTIMTEHSLTVPVFSDTLHEWRVHTGIDIATKENAEIYAAADGTVSAIYKDEKYGMTVEITHTPDFKTVYSNLSETLPEEISVGAEVKSGDLIATVGDTALFEIAGEPHLHFGIKVKGVSVNPMDYFSDETKKASLGCE